MKLVEFQRHTGSLSVTARSATVLPRLCKHILWVLPAILVLLSPSGCAKPSGNEVSLGQEFTLSAGQSASIAGENLKIQFIEVMNDSRCPINVTCIWEGRANCLVQFTQGSTAYRIVLTEPGLTDRADDMFQDYKVTFHLKPYPGEVENISKEDYRLQLTIDKQQ